MTYEEFALLPRSQKITLAVIKAKQRLKNFTFVSGSIWTRVMPYYVTSVTGAIYSFNAATSTLTITSAVNPNTLEIVAEYSFFFADSPVNQDVEYQARLIDIGALKLELDTENTGIAIESDSSIKLENTDGYFDQIYDTLIWENQLCELYSWSPLIPWTDKRLIYRGYINTKAFNEKVVTFTLKDTFVKLRENIPFTGTRLIYGKAKNLDCISLDPVGEGYTLSGLFTGRDDRDLLTGVVSGSATGNTITGTGTTFTTQLTVGDKIRVIDGLTEYSYTVNTITNNTSLVISGTISASFSGAIGRNANKENNIITSTSVEADFFTEIAPGDELTINAVKYSVASIEAYNSLTINEQVKDAFTDLVATNLPSRNYRAYNRTWEVSGHLLASYSTSIFTVISQRVFTVEDAGHIIAGDIIEITSNYYTVDRVSGNMIFLNQNALTTLTATNTVTKPAIQRVNAAGIDMVAGRDFTELNDVGYCRIVLDQYAELNVATEQVAGTSLVFTYNSQTVTSLSSTLDLTNVFAPRDFICLKNGSTTWYEISQVSQTGLVLVTKYMGSSYAGPVYFKKPEYLGDDSLVLVDCMGKKTSDGTWVNTASEAVKDVCNLLGFTNYNLDSFAKSKLDADYTISLAYPKSIGGKMPITRDAILEINKSVFGSLFSDSDFNIAYSVLNADRDESPVAIKDDDIISFTTTTKNQIIETVNATYRTELGTGLAQSYSFSNSNIPGISTTLALELCLYDAADAEIVTQRYAFFRSNSQTIVNIKGKLNLISKSLNDRVYLSLDRLFKRFGSSGNIKVGLINMISKDSSTVDIQVNDLGNIFSRVGAIAPNTANDYDTATELEKSLYCYICDNNTETPDVNNDESLGSNLIG